MINLAADYADFAEGTIYEIPQKDTKGKFVVVRLFWSVLFSQDPACFLNFCVIGVICGLF